MNNIVEIISGVSPYWKYENSVMALTLTDAELPIYTPVLVDKRVFAENHSSSAIRIVSNFFSRNGSWPGYVLNTHKNSLAAIDSKRVLHGRKVITVEDFEFDKLPKLHEFVKAEGAITFIMSGPKAVINFVESLGRFRKEFKHSIYFDRNFKNKVPSTVDDRLVSFLTLYDLRYAIPVYNRKRADGMCIHFGAFWQKDSDSRKIMTNRLELGFAVNNFTDNMLVVDGNVISKENFITNKDIDDVKTAMKNELTRIKNIPKLKKQQRKGKKDSKSIVDENNHGLRVSLNDNYYSTHTVANTATGNWTNGSNYTGYSYD